MNIIEFKQSILMPIKTELVAEYGFLSKWNICFDYAKKRAGMCQLTEKLISLSRHHIIQNDFETVKDTLLHEFAHAIAYELYKEKGHGEVWQQVAKQIGATPQATGKFNLPDAPWVLVHRCPKTNNIELLAYRYRRNKKITQYFLKGRPETKGELEYLSMGEYNAKFQSADSPL